MCRDSKMAELMREWHEAIGEECCFNADGIVDPAEWDKQAAGTKVLFVLKETNDLTDGAEQNDNNVPLTEFLMNQDAPAKYGSMWPRIAEWRYAVCHPEDAYKWYSTQKAQAALKNVAVMNLKKTPGAATAKDEEVLSHIEKYWEYIAREIELIDPDVIVFCGTWWMVQQKRHEYRKLISDMHASAVPFPNTDSKKRLVIDYWHPAARYPAIVMYYGIQGIVRAALTAKK